MEELQIAIDIIIDNQQSIECAIVEHFSYGRFPQTAELLSIAAEIKELEKLTNQLATLEELNSTINANLKEIKS